MSNRFALPILPLVACSHKESPVKEHTISPTRALLGCMLGRCAIRLA